MYSDYLGEINKLVVVRNRLRAKSKKWNIFNQNLRVIYKNNSNYTYNNTILIYQMTRLLSFIMTVYEYNVFRKILITQGMLERSPYKEQLELFETLTKHYILKWMPGMLTGHLYFARNYVYKWLKSGVKYEKAYDNILIKHCIVSIYSLTTLPNLILLNTLGGTNHFIAKEVIRKRVVTIGRLDNETFPSNITFRMFESDFTFRSLSIFLNIIRSSMKVGRRASYIRWKVAYKKVIRIPTKEKIKLNLDKKKKNDIK